MKGIMSFFKALMVGLLVAGLVGCAGTSKQTSTGEYIDDAAITAKVKTKLLDDKEVGGLRINVETFKGVVQLSGFAKTADEKKRAEELTRTVNGVKSVKNDIVVR